MEAIEGEQYASVHELFVVLAHFGHALWIGKGAFFLGLSSGFDDDHESHWDISLG